MFQPQQQKSRSNGGWALRTGAVHSVGRAEGVAVLWQVQPVCGIPWPASFFPCCHSPCWLFLCMSCHDDRWLERPHNFLIPVSQREESEMAKQGFSLGLGHRPLWLLGSPDHSSCKERQGHEPPAKAIWRPMFHHKQYESTHWGRTRQGGRDEGWVHHSVSATSSPPSAQRLEKAPGLWLSSSALPTGCANILMGHKAFDFEPNGSALTGHPNIPACDLERRVSGVAPEPILLNSLLCLC